MPSARLDDRAVVRIAGPDAKTLLQNVVTLDVDRVDSHGSGYGALLTPQGKVLWDFVLHRTADFYAADLRADQVEPFVKRLSLYRLRARAEIGPAPDLAVFTQWGGPPSQLASETPADPRLSDLGRRWVAPATSVMVDATPADWHRHRIALAIPEGGLDFAFGDAFPYDAGMDSLGAIAFEKGCYIGQEVVSRMRHRGTARRRVVAVNADGLLPVPGTELMAGDTPLGRLGSSDAGTGIAIARLDRARAAMDARNPIQAGGEVVRLALPAWATYDWPASTADGAD